MDFFNPEYQIWFILPAMVLMLFVYNYYYRRRYRKRLGVADTIEAMENRSRLRVWAMRIVMLLSVFFLILALMRPRWGNRISVQKELGIDIVFAIDISNSMNARDIPPSRLERVKGELSSLSGLLEGNRIGIILFAGASFIQCPLTSDINAVKLFLDAINSSMINLQGTDISSALSKAETLLENRFKRNRILFLVTDGETHEKKSIETAKKLYKNKQVHIFTMGVGTLHGAVVPMDQNSLSDDDNDPTAVKKDKSGKTVVSKLDEKTLKQLAAAGNGKYFYLGKKTFNVATVADIIKNIEKAAVGKTRLEVMTDRYQIFVAMGLFLFTLILLIPERRS